MRKLGRWSPSLLQTVSFFSNLCRALQTVFEVREFHPVVKNFLAGILHQPTVNDVSADVHDECLFPRVLRVGARLLPMGFGGQARLRRSVYQSWGTSGT
jgi:hypothetical protein